jgi:integrase
MRDIRIHDLRRTLGSWQAATGASLPVIGRTLQHKNVSTTAIYARLNLDPVRESMQKAATAMFAAGGLVPTAEVNEIREGKRNRKTA